MRIVYVALRAATTGANVHRAKSTRWEDRLKVIARADGIDDAAPKTFELIERARAMVPALRTRSAQCRRERRIPSETIADFHSSGLLRVLQPRRFGGTGGDFATFTTIVSTLAHGCGSSAWVYAVLAEHAWAVAMFPGETQEEFWNDPSTVASASLAPSGAAIAVPGGYELSGDWPFSSGCDFAQWVLIGSLVTDADGAKELVDFLVPMSDVEVLDDWRVLGLAATGSKTLRIRKAFVPERRAVPHEQLRNATAPGRAFNPETLCKAPRPLFGSFTLAAVLVGLADRAVQLFVERTVGRVSRGVRVATLDSTQLNVAEASAEAETACLIVAVTCERNTQKVAAGEEITLDDLALARRNAVYAAKLAIRAVERAFHASGSHAIFDDDPMQSVFCDANAAASHLFLNWELGARPYGQAKLGVPVDHQLL
jgi:alkylation response protein AidB-like acyl-CoA dehydrogenase